MELWAGVILFSSFLELNKLCQERHGDGNELRGYDVDENPFLAPAAELLHWASLLSFLDLVENYAVVAMGGSWWGGRRYF